MATPINQMGLASLLLGEWEKTKQPLQQRGTILPVGDYQDGRAGLAWPGLLAAPAEGMTNFGRYGYGDEAVADNARSAFDVAGGAVTGGLGVGLAGGMADDAVRAAPKANAQAGPAIATRETRTPFVEALANSMTPDARTDGVFYRGVNDPASPASDMWWASNSPRSASHFAIGDNAAVFPSTMKFSNPLELDAGGAWWESVPFAGGEKSTFDIAKLARDEGYDGVTFRNVQDDPYGGTVSDVVAALHPGTVYSATTGDLLYSNAPTGSSVPLAVQAAEQIAPKGIRAYHGSPHDFDRFSLDRIGTGEGAQAYGHGLYFAENEGVAKQYRKNLGYKDIVRQFRDQLPDDADGAELVELAQSGALPPKMARVVNALAADDWLGFDYPSQAISASFRGKLDNWDPSPELVDAVKNYGNMYEVNIRANPEDFLDWDKPLSQQSETVRKAVLPLAEAQAQRYAQEDAYAAAKAQAMGMNLSPAPRQPVDLSAMHGSEIAKMTGLREAGIPGIRYLDGMSRGAGEGSSNYVVFDDSLIDILRKYANAPTGSSVPLAVNAVERSADDMAKGARPEPSALIPKTGAMGADGAPQGVSSGSIAETAPTNIGDYIAEVNRLVDDGGEGPFFGPRYPGATDADIEAAYIKAFRSELDDRKGRFDDWEYDEGGNRIGSPYYDGATLFGDAAAASYTPYVAAGLEGATKTAGRELPMYQASSGSAYGTLKTPAGNRYKVRLADHARTSSQFDQPDFNIAPGAWTVDDFLRVLPTIYANAPTGAALPLAMEGQDQDPALMEVLRQYGLMPSN